VRFLSVIARATKSPEMQPTKMPMYFAVVIVALLVSGLASPSPSGRGATSSSGRRHRRPDHGMRDRDLESRDDAIDISEVG
jgi:hypothetical protein